MNEADASHDHEINDTDAIYKQGPSKPLLISTISLLAFFILGVVFAALNEVDTTISARGEFMTTTPNLIVEASASSVVKSVEVERGDAVSKGQIVAYLDDTVVKVNLKQNQEKIDNVASVIDPVKYGTVTVDRPNELKPTTALDNLYYNTVKRLGLKNTNNSLSEFIETPWLKKLQNTKKKIIPLIQVN